MIIIWVILYLISSYAMAKIGEKFAIGSIGKYFIPIYNLVLACRCAGISAWWTLGVFVPFAGVAVYAYIFGNIAKRLGKNAWLFGFGSLVFLPVLVMAWDSSRPVYQIEQRVA